MQVKIPFYLKFTAKNAGILHIKQLKQAISL